MSNNPNQFRLENVRLSYHALWEADSMPPTAQNQNPTKMFSGTFIFDTTNPAHIGILDRIEAQANRMALDVFKKQVRLSGPLIRDGNEKSDTDGYGEGTAFLRAASKNRIPVVDCDPSIPLSESDNKLVNGDYVNAIITLWVQDNYGQRRVNASLECVQFLRKGKPFGGSKIDAAAAFEKIDEEYGTPYAQGPGTPAPRWGNKAPAQPQGGGSFF